MEEIKFGDIVRVECRSVGSDSVDKVTKITKENFWHGKPYKILWCGKRGFRADSGAAVTVPFGYYIRKASW